MSSRNKCEDCGATRGLAEYSDGTYCHACHKYRPEKSLFKEQKVKPTELEVPEDKQLDWPDEAYDWINKYQDERSKSLMKHCFWSDKYRRVVFPSDCNTAAWMRSINEHPKWLFVGNKDIVFKYGDWYTNTSSDYKSDSSVCLVEDVVSSIKVSELMDCIALGSTNLKELHYDYLRNHPYHNVYIFLDGDDAGKKGAERIRNELKLLYKCVIIRGRLDPKEISINKLKELLSD